MEKDNERETNKRRRKTKKVDRKKIITGSIIAVSVLLVIYLGMSVYFINHFYFGSSINSISISGDTIEEANQKIESKIGNYKIELEGRDGINEEMTASEIGLKYDGAEKIKELKEEQNPFAWIVEIFNKKDTNIDVLASYDKNLLKSTINKMEYFNKSKIVNPKNASFKYNDGKYEIVKEVYGNKVNKEKLYDTIVEAIHNGQTKINLEEANCYENPKYLSDSKKVIDAQATLNKYVSSQITYTIGENSVYLDGSTIHTWLNVDKDMNAVINEAKVSDYVQQLAHEYNTVGETRSFKTSLGTNVQVSGGSYGWKINVPEETQTLISEIKDGAKITRKPIYSQTAASYGPNDIGNTYVEVNLSKQHVWYYKDGALVTEGNIVTGNASKNWATPPGVYFLNYKEKDATLKGENYKTPVKFWMPFNGGIGLHDAWWRDKFGGDIYKTDGSHGCVNLPPSVAEAIYNNITPGTPVVCYN